jgi:hypothetical protein
MLCLKLNAAALGEAGLHRQIAIYIAEIGNSTVK